MEATTLPWLDSIVGTVSGIAIGLLVVVNGLFAVALVVRPDRRFVDRWTGPLLATDAALLLAVIGTPAVAIAFKLGARGLTLLVAATPAKLMVVK
jgi:hypothetical protein